MGLNVVSILEEHHYNIMKKIILTLFLGIAFFPLHNAFASVLYLQPDFSSSTTTNPSFTYFRLGQFTTDASGADLTNGSVFFRYKKEFISCGTSQLNITLSTSTNSDPITVIYWRAEITDSETEYKNYELTNGTTSPASPYGMNLLPLTTYYIKANTNCSGDYGSFITDPANFYMYGSIADIPFSVPAPDDTRFTDFNINSQDVLFTADVNEGIINTSLVLPVFGTSSPITLNLAGLISDNDWKEDNFIRLDILRNEDLLNVGVANTDVFHKIIDFPIEASHPIFTDSTTTDETATGEYTIRAEIRHNNDSLLHRVLSWFTLGNLSDNSLIYSTTMHFVMGTSSAYDIYQRQALASHNDFTSSSTISIAQVKSYCNPLSGFDIVECLHAMFIPSPLDIQNDALSAQSAVLNKWPIGYLTRLMTIITGQSTSTLPMLTINVPIVLSSGTTTIDMEAAFAQGSDIIDSIHDPNTGATMETVFSPMVRLLVSVSVIMIIFHDITAIPEAKRRGVHNQHT